MNNSADSGGSGFRTARRASQGDLCKCSQGLGVGRGFSSITAGGGCTAVGRKLHTEQHSRWFRLMEKGICVPWGA